MKSEVLWSFFHLFWSKRIRTFECRYQKPMPCHLAILHSKKLENSHEMYELFHFVGFLKALVKTFWKLFTPWIRSSFDRHELKILIKIFGKMAEWFKATDCKSVDSFHRRFEPYSSQYSSSHTLSDSLSFQKTEWIFFWKMIERLRTLHLCKILFPF